MKRLLVTMALCLGTLTAAPLVASAHDATPDASPVSIIGAADPADCTVEPRSFENLMATLATPAAAPPAAIATPAVPELPAGEPADPATEQAVLDVFHEAIACINARSYWQVLSLYSDNLVRKLLANAGPITEDVYNQQAVPQPLPDAQRTEIIEVVGVVVLPDGRVAALIRGDDRSNPRPASVTLFYFVEQDGQWLIDDFVTTPETGTPTP